MSHYWKKCPHCGRTVEDGYGLPLKEFGNPRRLCRYCYNTYIDRSIINWEEASFFKKFLFCLDNGRFFLCFIPYIIATARIGSKFEWEDWKVYLACSPVFLITFALCVLYVKIRVRIYYGKKERKSKVDTVDPYKKYENGLFVSKSNDENEKSKRP